MLVALTAYTCYSYMLSCRCIIMHTYTSYLQHFLCWHRQYIYIPYTHSTLLLAYAARAFYHWIYTHYWISWFGSNEVESIVWGGLVKPGSRSTSAVGLIWFSTNHNTFQFRMKFRVNCYIKTGLNRGPNYTMKNRSNRRWGWLVSVLWCTHSIDVGTRCYTGLNEMTPSCLAFCSPTSVNTSLERKDGWTDKNGYLTTITRLREHLLIHR